MATLAECTALAENCDIPKSKALEDIRSWWWSITSFKSKDSKVNR